MFNLNQNLPTSDESKLAKFGGQEIAELNTKLDARHNTQTIHLTDDLGQLHPIEVPRNALQLFVEILTEIGKGNTVKIIPIHAEMTTQEAADMLNMSRPSFIKLLNNGDIPYRRVGNRRKVLFLDIKKYQQQLEQKRLESLQELSALDQDLDLGY